MPESDTSIAAQDPEIAEVQNRETGDLIPVHVAIGSDYLSGDMGRMGTPFSDI